MRLKQGEIYIKAEGFPSGAVTCFSTRLGGVESYEYKGMNPDPRRPQPLNEVMENCRILGEAAGFKAEDMYMLNQVHSDVIKRVRYEERGTGLIRPIAEEGDALITDEKGIALTIFTADCVPILLYDPVRQAVGAVHAGWRGTALDIAGKTVARMAAEFGCRASDLYAAIGPCISKCCFETDRDVPDAMRALLGEAADSAISTAKSMKRTASKEGAGFERNEDPENQNECPPNQEENGAQCNVQCNQKCSEPKKYFVDLKAVNKMLLERAGVLTDHIEVSPHCTVCEPELFWSHRRMGKARGSLGAVIMLK